MERQSQELGEVTRKAIKLDEKLPKFEATEGIRKTGTLSLRNDETLKEDKQFGNSFRRLGTGHGRVRLDRDDARSSSGA